MPSGWSKNCVFFLALGTFGAVPALAAVRDGVPAVDDSLRISVAHSVHPSLAGLTATGRVSASQPLEQMLLVLKMGTQSQARLDQLLRDQQDPASASYHQWLTPESFGASFGPSAAQVAAASTWLASHGLTVQSVAKGGLAINFAGTAGQVEEAFQTTLKTYQVDGVAHHGNASSVTLPLALAGYVKGVASLNDFRHTPRYTLHGKLPAAALSNPKAYLGSSYGNALGAVDMATIYGLYTYSSGAYSSATNLTGSGVTIGLVERTDIESTDLALFQDLQAPSRYTGTLTVEHNGTDPGILSQDEEMEAELDSQWALAAAPGATVKMAVSASTFTTDGVDLSAQYLVENNQVDVISVSFGSGEVYGMTQTENTFYDQLWAQAAAQGISVFVSSGDDGVTQGNGYKEVNGLASTPYDTAVGGTMFSEGAGSYWNGTGGTGTYPATATGHIPEVVWNESGVGASGGGPSTLYAKPSWQTGTGLSVGGQREVPDVAVDAGADHDPYLAVMAGELWLVGGTSVATPIMAGITALALERLGTRQGNLDPSLYTLAANTSVTAFHDIISGTNTFDRLVGYSAGTGYDMCTGLGSPNGAILVNGLAAVTSPITASISSPASQTIVTGTPLTFTGAASGSTFTGAASGSASTLTYHWDFGDGSTSAAASTSHTYSNTTSASKAYTATLTVSDGSYSGSASVTITVTPKVVATIIMPVTNAGVVPGTSITFTATASPSNGSTLSSEVWTFGDGSTSHGLSTTHTFAQSTSVRTVTFTATDSSGASSSVSLLVLADIDSANTVLNTDGESYVDVRALLRIAASWSDTAMATVADQDGVVAACDLNADGKVDDTDLDLWTANFSPVME
jgi:subtilase family serine protease